MALALDRLKSILNYDPTTGVFTWRASARNGWVGRRAGSVNETSGYRRIYIDGRFYAEHRLAWFYIHGEWPSADIDHRNRQRIDNRLIAIRQATRSENSANRKRRVDNILGIKGVRRKGAGRFEARIMKDGVAIQIGTFDSEKEAAAAYHAKAVELFGEFASGD